MIPLLTVGMAMLPSLPSSSPTEEIKKIKQHAEIDIKILFLRRKKSQIRAQQKKHREEFISQIIYLPKTEMFEKMQKYKQEQSVFYDKIKENDIKVQELLDAWIP